MAASCDARLTGRDRRVYGYVLASADGRSGRCRIFQKTIAEKIDSDRKGVCRSLGKLVDLNYLAVEPRTGRALVYRVIADEAIGQLPLFDATTAPRRAKPKPARRGQAAPSEGDLRRGHEAPSEGARRPPLLEQNLQQRADPTGSAQLRASANKIDRMMPGDAVPPEKAGAAPLQQTGAAPPSDRTSLAELARRLRDAAGDAINTAHPAFLVLSEPLGWIDAGCDLELDILPTIAGLAARARGSPVRTWSYFAGAIREARDRRLAARENVVAFPTSASFAGRPPRLKSVARRLADAMDRSARGEDPFATGDEPSAEKPTPRPGRFAKQFALRRRELGDDPFAGFVEENPPADASDFLAPRKAGRFAAAAVEFRAALRNSGSGAEGEWPAVEHDESREPPKRSDQTR